MTGYCTGKGTTRPARNGIVYSQINCRLRSQGFLSPDHNAALNPYFLLRVTCVMFVRMILFEEKDS